MKITIFTCNQPRHLSLVETVSRMADEVYVIHECVTVFPGQREDFYKKSEIMQKYFHYVMDAEKKVFGCPRFLNRKVNQLAIKIGDLNKLDSEVLKPALASDVYIVFGSSYIKGSLCDFIIEKKAINIHMGVSPYYRGSNCNFWALYDKKPEYVGATIHYLSKGLDSGAMIFHALPKAEKTDPFTLGMLAVKAAHEGLSEYIKSGRIWDIRPKEQDKTQEIRYARDDEFNDAIAQEYLQDMLSEDKICNILQDRDESQFKDAYILKDL